MACPTHNLRLGDDVRVSGKHNHVAATLARVAVLLCALPWSTTTADTSNTQAPRAVPAPAAALDAQPSTCVALHKGQVCYQWIELRWHNLPPGHYCLFNDPDPEALACWSDQATGSHRHRYASATTERYAVRRQTHATVDTAQHDGDSDTAPAPFSDIVLEISTAWVYRTGRRSSSGWRLF